MKSKTLKENKNFRRLYYRGKSYATPCLVTYIMPNKLGYTRVGITSGKKIGNAVKRNRARRVIRAAFSEYEDRLVKNYDIVFVARSKTPFVKTQKISMEMQKHFKELGVMS